MSNKSYSYKFYSLIGAGALALFGSTCYLFSLWKSPTTQLKEKSFSNDIDISLNYKGRLTQERAIKLMALIHSKTENYILKAKPGIEEERRNNLNNSKEYEKICNSLFELKNEAFRIFTNEIETTYGFTYDEITKVLDPIDPIILEEKFTSFTIPKFDDKREYNKEFVIEAFIYYANRNLEQMKNVQGLLNDNPSYKSNNEYFIYQLMILKYKADDELYMKYRITENHLKFLLFEYKLHGNKQIQDLLNKISEYEEMFNKYNFSSN